jgi:P27 family predicted phage terminase small subunit
MAPRGRPPKPTALKVITGNPGKRKLNKREPKPDPRMPAAPEHLDVRARREWNRLSKELHSIGVLTIVDRDVLADYCQLRSEYLEALDDIREHGRYQISQNGIEIDRPAFATVKKLPMQLNRLAGELGITPSSRSRVHAAGVDDDAGDDLLD